MPTTVKISDKAYEKLKRIQEAGLGRPSLKSLVEEAIDLYAEKVLKRP